MQPITLKMEVNEMFNCQTTEKLRELKLSGFLAEYERQLEQPSIIELSFDERLAMIVDAEYLNRKNRTVARLLKSANLRVPASIENIHYNPRRNLDKSVMQGFYSCSWILQKQDILINGSTGAGKTYISCALGEIACRNGYQTLYYRTTNLLTQIAVSRADGTYVKLLATLKKVPVLILDDFGLVPLGSAEGREISDIIESRCKERSTIIAGQIPVEEWHQFMVDPTVADAIIDRIVYTSHRIKIEGESMRKNF
ncbi:MAG: IS21-like element helper ATPase IstB [bacterium]